jgi:hypothetical protein
MTFGGRTYFVGTFAVVFHLAVIVGIFYASWTSAPSVNAPGVKLDGPTQPIAVRTTIIKTSPSLSSGKGVDPVQPIKVRTITIGGPSAPPLGTGPEPIKCDSNPRIKIVPPYLPPNRSANSSLN